MPQRESEDWSKRLVKNAWVSSFLKLDPRSGYCSDKQMWEAQYDLLVWTPSSVSWKQIYTLAYIKLSWPYKFCLFLVNPHLRICLRESGRREGAGEKNIGHINDRVDDFPCTHNQITADRKSHLWNCGSSHLFWRPSAGSWTREASFRPASRWLAQLMSMIRLHSDNGKFLKGRNLPYTIHSTETSLCV